MLEYLLYKFVTFLLQIVFLKSKMNKKRAYLGRWKTKVNNQVHVSNSLSKETVPARKAIIAASAQVSVLEDCLY